MRYLQKFIEKDLQNKMVFLGGPRQVGKTTLSKEILASTTGKYLNYDNEKNRKSIFAMEWKSDDRMMIFDEIHKYHNWKNFIKGLYDTEKENHCFFITGSARLDVYKKGGDSMVGRYFYWRLHPFTLDEFPEDIPPQQAFERFMSVGGFPEPFLKNDEEYAARWRKMRHDTIVREDIQELEKIHHIRDIYILSELLAERVSSMIVVSHLAQDIGVKSDTIKHWIEILERMYLCFSIRPYNKRLTRALNKPKKIYFFDNMDVKGDEGARFENLVASHLLKRVHFLTDKTGCRYELQYIRDKEGREVDFVIVKDGEIEELIEAKWTDTKISKHLLYYQKKINAPKVTQIVGKMRSGYDKDGVEVRSAVEYFYEEKFFEKFECYT